MGFGESEHLSMDKEVDRRRKDLQLRMLETVGPVLDEVVVLCSMQYAHCMTHANLSVALFFDTKSTNPSSSLVQRNSPTLTSVSESRVVVTFLRFMLFVKLLPRVSLREWNDWTGTFRHAGHISIQAKGPETILLI